MTRIRAFGLPGILAAVAAALLMLWSARAGAAAFDRQTALDMFPGADAAGELSGIPPVMNVSQGGETVGWAFSSYDAVRSVGYSGKKLDLLIGLDRSGTITGVRIIEQTEPIMVTGATGADLEAFAQRYVGRNIADSIEIESVHSESAESESAKRDVDRHDEKSDGADDHDEIEIDAVSGATITSLVINDAILGAARAVATAQGLIASERVDLSAHDAPPADFAELLASGALAQRTVTAAEFVDLLSAAGLRYPPSATWTLSPDAPVFELIAGIVTPPAIGRTLLGHRLYDRAMAERRPGDQLILIGSRGLLSFKGTSWRQTGVFERLAIVQDERIQGLTAGGHRPVERIEAEGAPDLRELGLFTLRAGDGFAPDRGFELRVLIPAEDAAGAAKSLSIGLPYALPEQYLLPAPKPPEPLWQKVWRDRIVEIAVLAAALLVLTGLFYFQNWFARRPKLVTVIRVCFLLFTLGFLGFHARAQLSVVNILSFANVLIDDFQWEFFLIEPLIFILWVGVVGGLLFWGRGPFCGWLCPFGALQELLNRAAKLARVPQLAVPWSVHVRLWPIKYLLFLGLLGYSLYSLGEAERLAEIEPFKTAIVLHFMREWPFVVFAGGVLLVGLFVERAFCRYVCPLGAALAIPGKLRISEWLLRHKECGSPCQRCAQTCMVQAIHPDGSINVNECLYCLHCQLLYYDDHQCPAMVQRRLRRERREALASPSLSTKPPEKRSRPANPPDPE